MKFLPILLAIICLSKVFGQKKDSLPEFGKVDKSELLLKDCDFDKNAEAEVLLETEEVQCVVYVSSVYVKITHRVRIKILKDKGLSFADVNLPYVTQSGDEEIKDIKAITYNLDVAGNIVTRELDKKAIYFKQINKRLGEKIFSFPEVKTGSIIEYVYKEDGTMSTGFRDWTFQKSIPVKYSRYSMSFPEELEIMFQPHCSLSFNRVDTNDHHFNTHIFSMENIPALRDEPFITSEGDYLERIESTPVAFNSSHGRINLLKTWPRIVMNLMTDPDFGMQLTKNIPRTKDLDDSLKKISSPHTRMMTIFHYVRKNMEWNGYTNLWTSEGVKSAWKDKKGTDAEINLILVNLLQNAGLSAWPILLSTRDNGIINTLTPGYFQFNKVMAHVEVDNKVYILDATDKFTPPHLIPWDVMYSAGLLIEDFETFKWGWVFLWDEKQTFRENVYINAEIDENGIMSGTAEITSADYSRAERLPILKKGRDKFIDHYFTSANAGIKVESMNIENESDDSLPLIQNVRFSQKLNASGKYRYFTTNLFTGLEKNPFTAERRFSDVYFGANQQYSILLKIKIPDGYVFDEMPKNFRMRLPDTSCIFVRFIDTTDGILSMRSTLEFKRPFYKISEYNSFREFYQKLFEYLNEQIVIRKKD